MPEQTPPSDATCLYLVVPPSEIAYFHSILEGYDDLAVMRTIEPKKGVVEVFVSPGREEDFSALVEALQREGVALGPADEDRS